MYCFCCTCNTWRIVYNIINYNIVHCYYSYSCVYILFYSAVKNINPTALPPVLPGQTDNRNSPWWSDASTHEWLAAGRNAGTRTLSLGLDSGEELNWRPVLTAVWHACTARCWDLMRAIPSLPILVTRFKLCSYRLHLSSQQNGGLYAQRICD